MDALPTSAFVVIQPEFLFGFSEAVFDGPPSERHAKEFAERPAFASRSPVTQEVLDFAGKHVASHDQRALPTYQLLGMRFSPARMPTNFPDFGAMMRVLDSIMLGSLLLKCW